MAAVLLVAAASPGDAAARPKKGGLDLQLERTPVIVKNSYTKLPPIGKKGGMGRNAGRDGLVLADQGLGSVYVRAGLVRGQPRLIRKGLRAFDYAFRRQRSDGSLPEEQTEGYAFFVEAVAHSGLLLKRTKYWGKFRGRLKGQRKRLRLAAEHMIAPQAWKDFEERNRRYTHSGFTTGTALGLTGKLGRSKRLQRYGREAVRSALRSQRRNGANPELGGYDVRYHMAGITYAQRYRVYFPGGRVKRGIERMTRRGLAWMDRKVARNGYINWRGSSRTCRERSSKGDLKTPGYAFAVRGFAYWGALKNRPRLVETARRLDPYPRAAGGGLCGRKKGVMTLEMRVKRRRQAAARRKRATARRERAAGVALGARPAAGERDGAGERRALERAEAKGHAG